MELINDGDKRRLLATVLEGWVRFVVTSLSIVPDLSKNGKVVFNGVTYKSSLVETLPVGEVARRLTLYMPIAVAKMATVFLGSEKLKLQLEDGLGSDAEPEARQVMRLAILADLGVGGIANLAASVAKSIRGAGYLEHVFARKMYEVAVRFRLEKRDLDDISSLVSETFVKLEGSPNKKFNNRKVKVLTGINQQRLQVDLGRKRDN